jgi:hypothetical protein
MRMANGFGKRGVARASAVPHQVQLPDVEDPTAAPEDESESRVGPALLALGLTGAVVLALLGGWYFAFGPGSFNAEKLGLIPDSQIPKPDADLSFTADLVERFPNDPRAHFFRGVYFLEKKDLSDAERELRTALTTRPEYLERGLGGGHIEQAVRMGLAIILVAHGRRSEAVGLAQQVCGQDLSGPYSRFRDMFLRTGICKKS